MRQLELGLGYIGPRGVGFRASCIVSVSRYRLVHKSAIAYIAYINVCTSCRADNHTLYQRKNVEYCCTVPGCPCSQRVCRTRTRPPSASCPASSQASCHHRQNQTPEIQIWNWAPGTPGNVVWSRTPAMQSLALECQNPLPPGPIRERIENCNPSLTINRLLSRT